MKSGSLGMAPPLQFDSFYLFPQNLPMNLPLSKDLCHVIGLLPVFGVRLVLSTLTNTMRSASPSNSCCTAM